MFMFLSSLQPLQQTVESTDVMNDKDPRLFYFISRGSHCYFMSVMLNGKAVTVVISSHLTQHMAKINVNVSLVFKY